MKRRTTAKKEEPKKEEEFRYRLLPGIFAAGGATDTGKTSWALDCGAALKDIAFMNGDVKGAAAMSEVPGGIDAFGFYMDLVRLREDYPMELDFYRALMDIINDFEPSKFRAIIFDPWHNFVEVFHSYVKKNKERFRANWDGSGSIRGAMVWQETRTHEMRILRMLQQEKASTILLTAHLGPVYIGGKRSEKMAPRFSPAVKRVADMRLWLRKNPFGPVPVALADKRLARRELDDHGRLRTINVMPYKLMPTSNEETLWDTIFRYWDDPIGFREPTNAEKLNPIEIAELSGMLTDEERITFNLMIMSGEDEETGDEETELKANIIRLAESGMTDRDIARSLSVSLPVVLKAKN